MRFVLGVAIVGLAVARAAFADEDPRVAQGKQLFGELNPRCTVCHSIEGKGNPKGAALDDVGTRWKVEELKSWLRSPAEMAKKHGKTRKPAMLPYPELEDDELDALVAYLASLKKPSTGPE
jgi:mono/diheme cytochrome c family protein